MEASRFLATEVGCSVDLWRTSSGLLRLNLLIASLSLHDYLLHWFWQPTANSMPPHCLLHNHRLSFYPDSRRHANCMLSPSLLPETIWRSTGFNPVAALAFPMPPFAAGSQLCEAGKFLMGPPWLQLWIWLEVRCTLAACSHTEIDLLSFPHSGLYPKLHFHMFSAIKCEMDRRMFDVHE